MKIKYYVTTLFYLLLSVIAIAQTSPGGNVIKMKVKYELSKPGDSLILSFGPQNLEQSIKSDYIGIVNDKGVCEFKIDQEFPYGQISISKMKPNPKWRNDSCKLAYYLFWENGDDIEINIFDSHIKDSYENHTIFFGVGSEKYTTIYKIRKKLREIYRAYSEKPNQNYNNFDDPIHDTFSIDTLKNNQLIALLEKEKSKISQFAYEVLKTDIRMEDYRVSISNLLYVIPNILQRESSKVSHELLIQQLTKEYLPLPHLGVSDRAKAASVEFVNFYGNFFTLIDMIQNGKPSFKETKNQIYLNSNGILRASLLVFALNKFGVNNEEQIQNQLSSAIKIYPYDLMFTKHNAISKRNVYQYIFTDTAGNLTSLGKFKSKITLLDFWYTGCGSCITYYKQILSKIEEEFKDDPRFSVISISSDKDFNKWKKSIETNLYTNKNAINLNAGKNGTQHPFYQDLGVFKSPFIILIDQNGNVLEFDSTELSRDAKSLSTLLWRYL